MSTDERDHHGHTVPWITRWTSEVQKPQMRTYMSAQGLRLSFVDETPDDRLDGILWAREGNTPGQGRPMWRDVHSHRQRRCQVEGRCQVCGTLIEAPIPWIIPTALATRANATIITDVAPTCQSCLQTAPTTCPHLSTTAYSIYDVTDYRLYAVFGDVVDTAAPPVNPPQRPAANPPVRHYQADRRLNGFLGNMMARQMIVQLWNYRKRPA